MRRSYRDLIAWQKAIKFVTERDLKYLQSAKADALIAAADDLGRALNGLIASIKNRAA
jgi:hypothetical protein